MRVQGLSAECLEFKFVIAEAGREGVSHGNLRQRHTSAFLQGVNDSETKSEIACNINSRILRVGTSILAFLRLSSKLRLPVGEATPVDRPPRFTERWTGCQTSLNSWGKRDRSQRRHDPMSGLSCVFVINAELSEATVQGPFEAPRLTTNSDHVSLTNRLPFRVRLTTGRIVYAPLRQSSAPIDYLMRSKANENLVE